MREIPILYSGPMIRAILDGRKTQTRRIIRLKSKSGLCNHENTTRIEWKEWCSRWVAYWGEHGGSDAQPKTYAPGDRLWVRESLSMTDAGIVYSADGALVKNIPDDAMLVTRRVLPGIFMPRWASRITLEVVSVRAERVQEISEADAVAEGCKSHYCSPEDTESCPPGSTARQLAEILEGGYLTAKCDFINLWDSINGKRPGCAWNDNPWVWVIETKTLPGATQ